jgi:hypothetical protein
MQVVELGQENSRLKDSVSKVCTTKADSEELVSWQGFPGALQLTSYCLTMQVETETLQKASQLQERNKSVIQDNIS